MCTKPFCCPLRRAIRISPNGSWDGSARSISRPLGLLGVRGGGRGDHFGGPSFRQPFDPPFPLLRSSQNGPRRQGFASPRPTTARPLTAPGRSAQPLLIRGKGSLHRLPWQGTTSPPYWPLFSPPSTH